MFDVTVSIGSILAYTGIEYVQLTTNGISYSKVRGSFSSWALVENCVTIRSV